MAADHTAGRRLRVVAAPPTDPRTAQGPVRRALAALDHGSSPAQLLRSMPSAALLLGLDRVLAADCADGVGGGTVAAARVAADARSGPRAAELAALLTCMSAASPEPELVTDRRRCAAVAALVNDLRVIPGFVLAPVRCDSVVVAVLYGDLARTGVAPGERHTDRLATFAVAAGYVLAAARLRATLDQVTAALGLTMARGGEAVPSETPGDALSPREIDVLRLMAVGRTNAQVGRELRITEGTVKSHVKHVFRKLDAANRAEAVARWIAVDRAGAAPGSLHRTSVITAGGSRARWS